MKKILVGFIIPQDDMKQLNLNKIKSRRTGEKQ